MWRSGLVLALLLRLVVANFGGLVVLVGLLVGHLLAARLLAGLFVRLVVVVAQVLVELRPVLLLALGLSWGGERGEGAKKEVGLRGRLPYVGLCSRVY